MKSIRLIIISLKILAFSICAAQTPDVSVQTELRFVFFQDSNRTSLRSFDPMGRFSTITLSLALENGLWIRASQRFSRFDRDATESILDATYIEAPMLWRLGYLDLRFGAKNLLRDYGFGGEIRSYLLIDQLPFTLAVVDTGDDRPKGVVTRLGDRIGVSLAKGNNFATGGSSLNAIQDPDEATGRGTGYKLAYGLDGTFTVGLVQWSLEFLALREGVNVSDLKKDLFDLSWKFKGIRDQSSFLVGITQELRKHETFFRFETQIQLAEKFQLYGIYKQIKGKGRVGIGTVIKF